MNYIKGDLLNIDKGFICHQVNCQGVMDAGIAKAIKKKYPVVFEKYKEQCDKKLVLGSIMVVPVTIKLSVINMAAQDKYGRDKRYTDYKAFRNCLKGIRRFLKEYNYKDNSVYFPYKIGCNLAGGEWNIIEPMIKKYLPNSNIIKFKKG